MLEHIKLLLGICDESKDDLISTLIIDCMYEALLLTNREETTTGLTPIVEKMVIQNYNRLGTQGVSSQSYSGVSESFVDGYSSDILKALKKLTRVVIR